MTFKLPVKRRDLPYFWLMRFKTDHPTAYLALSIAARFVVSFSLPVALIIGGCLIMSGRMQDPIPPALQHGLIYILIALALLGLRRRDSDEESEN